RKDGVIVKGDELSELDKQNLKSVLMEIGIYASLTIAMILAKGAIDEEDEEENYLANSAKRILINSFYRVQSDITFYINPGTFEEIISNALPVFKTLGDFTKAMDRTLQYLDEGEDYRGYSPTYHWSRAFPLTNQMSKAIWMSENLLEEKFGGI